MASLGGHLELLHNVASTFEDFDLIWVTSEGARAESLRAAGEQVRVLPRLDRSSLRRGSLLEGCRLALRERPACVISTGAGLTVPFALTSRALGARLIFLETMARVSSGSLTGRILAPFSEAVLVQWPELRGHYPNAVVCHPQMLENVPELGSAKGVGTFVTVGSHDQPFDRLLSAVARAAADGVLPRPIHAQVGVGRLESAEVETIAFMSPDAFQQAVDGAQIVVTHAGAGAVSTALRSGKRPLVMARRADLGEHVDDHQTDIADKLKDFGVIVALDSRIDATHLEAAQQWTTVPRRAAGQQPVAEALRSAVQSH